MIRVKICGIMNQRDANICIKYGANALGFVVEYPVSVPWNISVARAKELIDTVTPFVSTCIVTGGPYEKILDIAMQTRPNYIQLHYNETLDDVMHIARELKKVGIKTIKALRIDKTGACAFEISDPQEAIKELEETDISAILLDSYTEYMPGGTGIMINQKHLQEIMKMTKKPLILAGGIKPGNVYNIITHVQPYAIDVLSGVEDMPGYKSEEKVIRLMKGLSGFTIQ
jgi:phosphoribosylanthranilate isomerase